MNTGIRPRSDQSGSVLSTCAKAASSQRLKPPAHLGREAATRGRNASALAWFHPQDLGNMWWRGHASRAWVRKVQITRKSFSKSIAPAPGRNGVARMAGSFVNQPVPILRWRALKATASARDLPQGATRRRAAEAALKKTGKHSAWLLARIS
jgi:hypothetical protein